MHRFIDESCPVVFKHSTLTTCLINFHLEYLFYIDMNMNIISYFNTLKMFLLFFSLSLVKKMKHPSFLIHFGKRIQDKCWLGVELGRCDRQTVVAKGVNLSWFKSFVLQLKGDNWYELKSSSCYFEMLKSMTPKLKCK